MIKKIEFNPEEAYGLYVAMSASNQTPITDYATFCHSLRQSYVNERDGVYGSMYQFKDSGNLTPEAHSRLVEKIREIDRKIEILDSEITDDGIIESI